MLHQDRFDLAQLDAKSADLDLPVGAPDKLQTAAFAVTNEIACSIEAARLKPVCGERIGNKPFGRQFRTVQIAARDAAAADIKFAAFPRLDWL